jgi:hypothetical protein
MAHDSGLEYPFDVIVGGILVVTAVGLLLAELGRFSLPGVALLAGLVTVAAWKFLVASPQSQALGSTSSSAVRPSSLDLADWLALLVLIVAAGLFFRPFENVYGGRDGGVYVNTGIHLARTGSLAAQDTFFATLPSSTQARLLWTFPGTEAMGLPFKYPGFFWVESEQRIVPQFVHAYPVWVAALYSLFGLRASLYVTPLLAWLSLLAIYLAARRLFGWWAGLAAMLLLLVNPSQIWFARYANADVGFQFLFLAGLVLWARFVSRGGARDGMLAGAAFGATLLFKLDASFLLVPIGLATALAWFQYHDRPWKAFTIPWLGLSAWGLFHGLVFSRPYTVMSFSFVSHYLWSGLVLGGLLLTGLVAFTVVQRLDTPFRPRIARMDAWERPARLIVAVLLLVLAAYLYLIPPAGTPALAGVDRLLTGSLDPGRQNRLQELGWYLTPVGLLLAVLGAALLLAGRSDTLPHPLHLLSHWERGTEGDGSAAIGLLLLAALVSALINLRFLTMGGNDHIWAIRRHISVVMPCAALLAAYAIIWLSDMANRLINRWHFAGRLGSLTSLALVALVAGRSLQLDWPLIRHREFGDAIATVAEWAHQLPPDSVTVFESGMVGNLLAPLLTWRYDRQVLVEWNGTLADPDNALALATVAQTAESQSRPIYVVTTGDGLLPAVEHDYRALAAGELHVPELEQVHDHLPQRIQISSYPYRVYRLQPGSGRIFYEAESLLGKVGAVMSDALASDGKVRHAAPGDGSDFLAYGPYVTFLPGRYEAQFLVRGTGSDNPSNVIAVLDVAARAGNLQLARRELTGNDLDESSYQGFSLVFDNPTAQALEFRVAVTGRGEVWLDTVTVDPLRH